MFLIFFIINLIYLSSNLTFSSSEIINLKNCTDHCIGLSGLINTPSNCFCDQCDQFDDCCSDSILKSNSQSNDLKCNVKVHNQYSIYTVQSCSSKFINEEIKQKCINPIYSNPNSIINYIPVYSNKTKLVYRNIYCLQCNMKDISVNDLVIFELNSKTSSFYESDDEFIIKNFQEFNQSIFEISFKIPDNLHSIIRLCINSINQCPENTTNLKLKSLCESNRIAYRYTNENKIYKNEYCAICNGDELLECNYKEPRKLFNVHSLQLLFDLSDLRGEIEIHVSIKSNDGDVSFNNNKQICNSNETKSLIYCTNTVKINKQKWLEDKCMFELTLEDIIKKYLTIFGQLTSIISLILLLIFYFTNKVLRNLPGKILISLSVSLLFSQIFFLISIYLSKSYIEFKNTECKKEINENMKNIFSSILNLIKSIQEIFLCYLFGLFTHYFYLSFFIWSNIMAYDLYKMFTQSCKNKKSLISETKSDLNMRFLKYSLIGWLSPFILILLLIIKNEFFFLKMSYGFSTCYISSQIDLFLFFVLPICIILILNIFYLIVSIRSINLVDKTSKKYLKSECSNSALSTTSFSQNKETNVTIINNNNNKIRTNKKENKNIRHGESGNGSKRRLILFIKLFILTGMSWLLGILSSIINDRFSLIWYIYIVLNSLQGLFIFTSYAFNPQTKKHIRQRFYKTFSSVLSRKSQTSSTSNDDNY